MNKFLFSMFAIFAVLTVSTVARTAHKTSAPPPIYMFQAQYMQLKLQFEKLHPGITLQGATGDPSMFMRKAGGQQLVHDISVRLGKLRGDIKARFSNHPNDAKLNLLMLACDQMAMGWDIYTRGEITAVERLASEFVKIDAMFKANQ